MAFPAIQTTNESSVTTAGTTHQVNLPSGITSGDLILILCNKGAGQATFNALNGWTELIDEDLANGNTIWYRRADGTEGSSVTFTSSASTRSAHISFRISGATNPSVRAPEISTVATGTSTDPDPGTCTPTGGAKDYLWIAFFGCAGEELDDDTWVNSSPTNYSTPPLQKACGTAGTNLGGMAGAASRTANAASENPSTFNKDVSTAWRAYTIAVHPEIVYTDSGSGTITLTGSGTDSYGHTYDDSGSGNLTTSGSGSDSKSYADSASGNLSITGSGTDEYEPPPPPDFPSTGVLDDFNRSNEDPLSKSGAWSGPFMGVYQMKVVSNQAASNGSVINPGDSYWNTTFGPDTEVYVTGYSLGSAANVLVLRGQQPGSGADGYRIQFHATVTAIYRIDNGGLTQLNTTGTGFADGDTIGARILGDDITVYKNGTELLTATDGTYSGAGYIALGSNNSTPRFDNFGGGTVSYGVTYDDTGTGTVTLTGSCTESKVYSDGNGIYGNLYLTGILQGGIEESETLGSGYNYPHGSAVDGDGRLWFSTRTGPARVVRFNAPLTDLSDWDGVTLSSSGRNANGDFLIYVAAVDKLYMGTGDNVGGGAAIHEIDPDTMTVTQKVQFDETPGGGYFGNGELWGPPSLSSDGTYLYSGDQAAEYSSELRKFRISDFAQVGITSGINGGKLHSQAYDSENSRVYFSCVSGKLLGYANTSDMTFSTTSCSPYTMTDDAAITADHFWTPIEGGATASTMKISKDLSTKTVVPGGQGAGEAMWYDPSTGVWVGFNVTPGVVICIDPDTEDVLDTLNPTAYPDEIVVLDGKLFAATWESPTTIERLRRTGVALESHVGDDSGSGSITISGSSTDEWFMGWNDAASGTITLSGVRSESFSASSSRTGSLTVSGQLPGSIIEETVNLPTGAGYPTGSTLDGSSRLFLSTQQSPARVIKFNTPDSDLTDANILTLPDLQKNYVGDNLIYVSSNGKLYLGTGGGAGGSPGTVTAAINEIDPSTLTATEKVTFTETEGGGFGNGEHWYSPVLASDGTYLIVLDQAYQCQATIRKYRLSDFQLMGTTGIIEGLLRVHTAAYDSGTGRVYFAAFGSKHVGYVNISDLSYQILDIYPLIPTDDSYVDANYYWVALSSGASGSILKVPKNLSTYETVAIQGAGTNSWGLWGNTEGLYVTWRNMARVQLVNPSDGTVIDNFSPTFVSSEVTRLSSTSMAVAEWNNPTSRIERHDTTDYPRETHSWDDSGAGTISVTGSSTESWSRVFNDSGSGSLAVSGTSTRSSAYTDSGAGSVTLTGSGIEQWEPPGGTTYDDAMSGSVIVGGSSEEEKVYGDGRVATITLGSPALGTLFITGTSTRSSSYTDSGSGTITISAPSGCLESRVADDARSGTITLSGSGADSRVYTDSRAITITASAGATSQSYTHTGSGTGTITISGYGFDHYVPPGGEEEDDLDSHQFPFEVLIAQ